MKIISANCKLINNKPVLSKKEDFFEIEVFSDSDGYFDAEIEYSHENHDNWIFIFVTNPDGEKLKYAPSLPHGRNKKVFPLLLKKGINNLKFTYDFGNEIFINSFKVLSPTKPVMSITPSTLSFFKDSPKTVKFVVTNYANDITDVTVDGKKFNFVKKPKQIAGYYPAMNRAKTELYLNIEDIFGLKCGEHLITVFFKNGEQLNAKLCLKDKHPQTDLKIVNFDVKCALSSLICLPNGKNLLIDSSSDRGYEELIKKYLENNNIQVDYYLLTHFHSDHYGGIDSIVKKYGLIKPNPLETEKFLTAHKEDREKYLSDFKYLDSTMLCFYDELHNIWDLGGVKLTVLNSRYNENGILQEVYNYPYIKYNEHNYENATSVSLILNYNGFKAYLGADNYAYTQTRLLERCRAERREAELTCEFYNANHHFHCDINAEFIRILNPKTVFVSVCDSVYSRSTYMHDYLEGVENYLYHNKRLNDTLISCEIGTCIVYANNSEDWYYETIYNADLLSG